MSGKSRRGTGWLLAVLVLGVCGCNDKDVDQLARVARKAAEKVQSVTGGTQGKVTQVWQALRANCDEMALDARVAARLRWEKVMAGAAIQVQANGTTVELRGTATSAAQHDRALELAQETVGVEKVVDGLTIEAAAEPQP
jgi:hyperosmotically inducible periplasmic protein